LAPGSGARRYAREEAAKAIRSADRAEAEAWSIQMEGYGGPAQPSPTNGESLHADQGKVLKPVEALSLSIRIARLRRRVFHCRKCRLISSAFDAMAHKWGLRCELAMPTATVFAVIVNPATPLARSN
jgi:hypothetical protein